MERHAPATSSIFVGPVPRRSRSCRPKRRHSGDPQGFANLRTLSIYQLSFVSSAWGNIREAPTDHFLWASRLQELSTVEELGLSLFESRGPHSYNHPDGEVGRTILSNLPSKLKYLVYASSIPNLVELAPSIFFRTLTNVPRSLPSSLVKINITTQHWKHTQTRRVDRHEVLKRVLGRERGLLAPLLRAAFVEAGIELVCGERWISTQDEVSWAHPWDLYES